MNEKPPSNGLTRQFRVLRIHETWPDNVAKGQPLLPHRETLPSPHLLALSAGESFCERT